MSAGSIAFAYFGWPLGAVYSNLIASGICALLVYLRLRVHQRRMAAEQAFSRKAAEHALIVAADLFRHHTGRDHSLAPPDDPRRDQPATLARPKARP